MGTPSPAKDPGLWMRVGLGPHVLGGGKGKGVATVKAKSSQKLDEKEAGGKHKTKTTQKGIETSPVEIAYEGPEEVWPEVEAILEAIDPNGPAYGGPFTIDHPDTHRRRISFVMVREIGEVAWMPGGRAFKVAISCREWNPDKEQTRGTATKTPEKALTWNMLDGVDEGGREPEIGRNGALVAKKGIAAAFAPYAVPFRVVPAAESYIAPDAPNAEP